MLLYVVLYEKTWIWKKIMNERLEEREEGPEEPSRAEALCSQLYYQNIAWDEWVILPTSALYTSLCVWKSPKLSHWISCQNQITMLMNRILIQVILYSVTYFTLWNRRRQQHLYGQNEREIKERRRAASRPYACCSSFSSCRAEAEISISFYALRPISILQAMQSPKCFFSGS